MQRKPAKTWLIVTGLFVHASIFAYTAPSEGNNMTLLSSEKEQPRNLEKRLSALEKRKGGLLNPPARPLVEDFDINLFGDFLIWQPHMGDAAVSVKNRATSFTTPSGYQNLQKSEVEHYNFDYRPGFRLGVDIDTPYDGWDVSLTWLRFNARGKETASVTGNDELFVADMPPGLPGFVNSTTSPVPVFSSVSSIMKLYLNQLDLDMGREFFVSQYVTLRPHFGLRTSWIRQRKFTDCDNGIPVNTPPVTMPDTELRAKLKWWGLGVVGGLDTQWLLGNCGLSIYANLAAAIEYGFQKGRQKATTATTTPYENPKNDAYRDSRPILDLQLGLRWARNLWNDSYNFGLHAGWEHHIYFAQEQFPVELAPQGSFTTTNGNLSFQGWTLGAHLAF